MGCRIRVQLFCLTQISFLILLGGSVAAQTSVKRATWDWTKSSDHHNAVVKVSTDAGAGSGVLVHVFRDRSIGKGYEGLVLTAHHVVSDGEHIKVAYQNGKKAKDCTIVSIDESVDVAFLRVWVPEGAKEVPLATAGASPGDKLEICGYGGGVELDQLRHFAAQSDTPTNAKQIFAPVSLLSGDSGGPVFNADQKVVGIVSGGWFWFDGVTSKKGLRHNLTWPARTSNLEPILKLVSELKQSLPAVTKSDQL